MSADTLNLPEKRESDPWMGGTRHRFDFSGCQAWVVEPPEAAPGRPWFAVPEWPSAFPARNGVRQLLSLGFTMVHLNLFGFYANPEAVGRMADFYRQLREWGFAEKGALIGMSLGGLYSFRFAQTHPECVSCIYADAPVCDLAFANRRSNLTPTADGIAQAYGAATLDQLRDHPLSPVNAFSRIAEAGIPVLMLLGLDDIVVDPATNGSLLAERFTAAGGRITVNGRPSWGHHPHGLDDPAPIVRFILRNTVG